MKKSKPKILVLFSGGLDSKLVARLMKNQAEVECIFFILPFGGGCCNDKYCAFRFTQKQLLKLFFVDCTKGKLLEEYLEIIREPKHGHGSGLNPCIDCRIFMFKKAKEYADKEKIDIIASGEVLGERPMSQTPHAIKIIAQEIGFEVLRPLSAKLLPETNYEKQALVDRAKFFGFHGRSRKGQIELAKKFKIKYPNPGGGCLLCEKELTKRLKFLLDKNLINGTTLPLTKIGRHFNINCWFVVGRNEQESLIIEKFKNSIKSEKGKPAVYFNKTLGKNKAKELQKAYQIRDYQKFERFKL